MKSHRVLTLLKVGLVAALALGAMAAWAVDSSRQHLDDGVLRIHLLWTNDVHGHIGPEDATFMNPACPPPLGGGASAAAYIKKVRDEAAEAGEEVFLIDVGDMFQGAPIGSRTKGTAVIEYFNAIGYQMAVPGNHDFDMGRDNCERLAHMSDFPWLCANLVEESTGEIVDWCQPYKIFDFQGIKVGVIGIITPSTGAMSFPENVKGLIFEPMPETVSKYRDIVKAEGADLVLLAIHEGLPYDPERGWKNLTGSTESETATEQQGTYGSNHSYGGMNLMELVNRVPGIDVAVGGHTHRGYYHPWIDPVNHTMCFETFGNGSSQGHAVLLIDRETGTLLGYEGADGRGTLVTLFEDEIWPDEEIADVIRPYHEKAEAALQKVVGRTSIALGRGGAGANLVGNLVTDAMREYFDADFTFQNLGGLRSDIPAGDITARNIFTVLPFGNELVQVEMDGRMLRRVIERKLRGESNGICVSGVKVSYDKSRPDWDRVVELEVGGEPWDPDRTYRTVFTNFLLEGNSGLDFLTAIPSGNVTPTQITTSESVERYLSLHSPVHPHIDDRWVERPGMPQADYLKVSYLPES